MSIVEQNYRIEGFLVLLNQDCILSRYYPLIPYKKIIVEGLKQKGCKTKRDCSKMTDEELIQSGIPNDNLVALFRSFLTLYDYNDNKMRTTENYSASSKEKTALLELSRLPGVQLNRALLYYLSGYTGLNEIAKASPSEMLEATSNTIRIKQLQYKPPLPKEVRTHIAVATALTCFSV